jgi:hypothetical protein
MQTEGVILAGGFVQHPMQWGVRLAEKLAGSNSLSLLTRIIFGYAKTARFRFRHSPETLASIDEFVARRTDLDRQAATWRLRLVGQSDARETARQIEAPVFALTGVLDPIVPWPFVFPWLHRYCPRPARFKNRLAGGPQRSRHCAAAFSGAGFEVDADRVKVRALSPALTLLQFRSYRPAPRRR